MRYAYSLMESAPRLNARSLDRRRAAGKNAALYLHSARKGNVVKASQHMDWDPAHFRLFVGNLGPEVTTETLRAAFSKYESMSKAHVPTDHGKNRGYGFVAFEKSSDYLRAFKEMNGKYVGLRPVQLKRAESTVRPQKENLGKAKWRRRK